jgi:hypothetical protein
MFSIHSLIDAFIIHDRAAEGQILPPIIPPYSPYAPGGGAEVQHVARAPRLACRSASGCPTKPAAYPATPRSRHASSDAVPSISNFCGQSLGAALIVDDVARAMRAEPAIFALGVDAKHESAAGFYKHLGFQPFASRQMTPVSANRGGGAPAVASLRLKSLAALSEIGGGFRYVLRRTGSEPQILILPNFHPTSSVMRVQVR